MIRDAISQLMLDSLQSIPAAQGQFINTAIQIEQESTRLLKNGVPPR
jgi:hypothetical protein